MRKPRKVVPPTYVTRTKTDEVAITICRALYAGKCVCEKSNKPAICAAMTSAARSALRYARYPEREVK